MAAYKVINKAGSYRANCDVKNVINYVTSAKKAPNDGIFGGAVIPKLATLAMERVTAAYHNDEGLHLRHSILSFAPDEGITPQEVKEIARRAITYYEGEHQILAAVHEDREHLHIHFVMNTTNYTDGSKYRGTRKDYYGFLQHLDIILEPYGLSVKAEK